MIFYIKLLKKSRLFEKFDFFINYESLWAAAAMKRKIVQHMYIYKQQRQQTQQDNELTQGKTSIVCSKVSPSKIYTTQN